MSKEAMRLALEALESCGAGHISDGGYQWHDEKLVDKAITALREALAEQPAQQEPDELRHIGEQDCLLDVDEKAWRSLVENRGGCRCHISPPCGACSNPISEEEMNEVGYTYTSPQPAQRTWVGLTDEQAYEIGTKGGEPTEAERLLFEAWMRGHCWAVIGDWDGKTYVHPTESSGYVNPSAMLTRQLWAAWRDRGALEAAHGIKENT